MVKHIAFTLYPVKDMARAREFYEKGLGLRPTHDFQGKWVEYILGNGCFALTNMAGSAGPRLPSPNAGGVIAFEVDAVDATVEKLKEAGARVLEAAFDTPVCRMAFVTDTEGNALCVHAKKG